MVGNKTRRRQPACVIPRADMAELVVKSESGEARPRRGGPFIGGGTTSRGGRED
jgi:hypothetical protein